MMLDGHATVCREQGRLAENAAALLQPAIDRDEVVTAVMTLSGLGGVRLLEPLPTGGPLASARGVRASDDSPVFVVVVTAPVDAAMHRRIRTECTELEALLDGAPPTVLPLVDHGVDAGGRPFLVTARPGPSLDELRAASGPLPLDLVTEAARALGSGLSALAGRGLVGPPPKLWQATRDTVVLGAPLPSALDELVVALGDGSGHEPPEVLAGDDWTPVSQTYAAASTLWTLLAGRAPYGTGTQRLNRLLGAEPPQMQRPDVPDALVDLLRRALAPRPSDRPASPAELAAAVAAAVPGGATASGGVAWDRETILPVQPVVERPLGNNYLLDHEIGRGATGVVWAGRRRADGARVAIKILHGGLADDTDVKERFLREYTIQARLQHPHLVRVRDLYADDGVLAIVMDFVEGTDLRRLVGPGKLPFAGAATLLAQTAEALATMHAKGIVHRDVKPANVLAAERDGRWHAWLTDFGISRAAAGSSTTQLIGTPAYLAPELADGEPPQPPADVYALGVTAYELLAGSRPFEEATITSWMRAHRNEPVSRPAGLDNSTWALISECLAKDPAARPGAAQVAARWSALAAGDAAAVSGPQASSPVPDDGPGTILSGRPLPDRPVTAAPRSRRRLKLLLATAAVAVLGTATGVYLAEFRSEGSPHLAPSPTASAFRQYLIPAAGSVDPRTGVAVLTWSGDAAALDGFRAFFVFKRIDLRLDPASPSLGADVTSHRVGVVSATEDTCFSVMAYGVPVPQHYQAPPETCVRRTTT